VVEFSHTDDLAIAPAELFARFLRPACAVEFAPPAFPLKLVDGPAILTLGATFTLQARRYGLTQKLIHRLAEIEPPVRLVFEQVRGPFRSYRLAQRFEPLHAGCRLLEEVTFEPPGGVLGQLLTGARLRADLDELYRLRRDVFRGLGWLLAEG
jgi:ligand-binding SRPBCC domain-containing protein